MLKDENGEEVALKEGDKVDVTIEADPKDVLLTSGSAKFYFESLRFFLCQRPWWVMQRSSHHMEAQLLLL